jgi:hypothetical protein
MLPLYKQAEKHRQENEKLREELAKGQATGATSEDIAYWRKKYEVLLASVE